MTEPVSRDRKQSSSKRRSIPFDDQLLVETVANLEQIRGGTIDEPAAVQAAVEADGDLEQRLAHRAASLSITSTLRSALRDVRSAIGFVIFGALLLVLLAGAAAAQAALATFPSEPVNFFWVIIALLGVQTIMLLIWIALLLFGSRVSAGPLSIASLGGLLVRAARFLFAKTHHTPAHAAASSAIASVTLHGPIAKWTLSSISHALWLAFNVGCLATLILLLSAKQYSFAWETTILSSTYFVPMTRALAALPDALGFHVPTELQIEQSQWRSAQAFDQSSDTRQAWSSLLVGAIVVYGFAPRLLLLAYGMGARRGARSRYQIDLSRPEFARLEAMLMPAQRLGVIDADDSARRAAAPLQTEQDTKRDDRPVGPPAIIGLELSGHKGTTSWPPPLHAVRWIDLGFVETGDDQRRAISQLQSSPQAPQAVVIVCALMTTPDRGIAAFIQRIRQTVSQAICLVLTGGQNMRERGDGVRLERRIDDWHTLAANVGIEARRIVELDLDHFTQASAAKLAALIESDRDSQSSLGDRRIEQAFDLIVNHARALANRRPSTTDGAANLNQAIFKLYLNEHGRLSPFNAFNITWDNVSPTQLTATLTNSASQVLDLLPMRMRLKPRWLAAGAAAGALGCLAAATFVAPVAIAALPMWSAVGAAVSTALSSIAPKQQQSGADGNFETEDMRDIRSATLLAIILEAQGRPETAITRIIDQTMIDEDDLQNAKPDEVSRWLDQVRHRLDLALSREAAP